MEKKLFAVLVITMIIFITGCSKNKKLTCKFIDESTIGKVSTEQIFTFDSKGKKITNFNVKIEYSYEDNYLELVKNAGQTLEDVVDTKSICANYTSHEGVSCTSKVDKNILTITIKGKVDATDDAYYKGTYDEVKNIYSELNYTCK